MNSYTVLEEIRTDFWFSAFRNQRSVGLSRDGLYDLKTDRDFILTWIGYSI